MRRKDLLAGAAGMVVGNIHVADAKGSAMNVTIAVADDDGLGLSGVVPVTVTVSPVRNLRFVKVLVDGHDAAQGTVSPFVYRWDTTKVSDGTHIVQAVAQYKTRKSTAQIAVTVNNTVVPPPQSTVVTPAQFQSMLSPGATISHVTVTGSVTIDVSGITVSDSVVQGDVAIPFNVNTVTLQDVTLGKVTIGETALAPGQQPPGIPATDIVLRRVDGAQFLVGYALRVRILDGDWGPSTLAPAIKVFNPWDPPSAVPVDVLVEGNYFHDIAQLPDAEHVEGILMYAGNGLAVRNNRFVRCRGTGDLSVSFLHLNPYNPLIANVLVSGNQGSTEPGTNEDGGFFNVQYDGQIPNLTFTGNTFPKGMLNVDFVPSSGIRTASPPPNWPPPVGG